MGTPSGSQGGCMDIKNCPLLLADLDLLRKSICFKSLFVPGVCCPENGVEILAVDESLNVVNQVKETAALAAENEPSSSSSSNGGFVGAPISSGPGSNKRPQFTAVPTLDEVSTTSRPVAAFQGERHKNRVPGTNLECGVTKIPQGRIVGGNDTFEGEYPWMVAIYLHGNGRKEFWCGGALISPLHVITAAHCTKDAKKRPFLNTQFSVKLGEWDLSDADSYSEEFRIVDYSAYPEFKSNGFYNDVAVFKLDKPVIFNQHIQPICLPTAQHRTKDFVGTLPVVLGWGTDRYGGEEVPRLQGLPLPVWTNKDCDNAYFQPITEVFLCAGYPSGGRDACQGDSGGPLMLYDDETQSWMLIGVVSFGNRCAEPGYPGVYTRITHFMDWIPSK